MAGTAVLLGTLLAAMPALAASAPVSNTVAVANPVAFAKANGIPLTRNGGKLVGIWISRNRTTTTAASTVANGSGASVGTSGTVSPDWFYQYDKVTNVLLTGFTDNTNDVLRSTQSNAPGPLSLTASATLSNSFSASVSVGAQIVSDAVNFDVTGSETWSNTDTVNVPSGQTWELYACPQYAHYSYEIWYPNWGPGYTYEGNGTATEFSGIDFVAYQL